MSQCIPSTTIFKKGKDYIYIQASREMLSYLIFLTKSAYRMDTIEYYKLKKKFFKKILTPGNLAHLILHAIDINLLQKLIIYFNITACDIWV
jgi:hypothetical protein